jgi:hypothetical protein
MKFNSLYREGQFIVSGNRDYTMEPSIRPTQASHIQLQGTVNFHLYRSHFNGDIFIQEPGTRSFCREENRKTQGRLTPETSDGGESDLEIDVLRKCDGDRTGGGNYRSRDFGEKMREIGGHGCIESQLQTDHEDASAANSCD